MTVDQIFQLVNFQLNKDQSGNTLNGSEFNLCLQYANIQYFRTLVGLPESYKPGFPLPKMAASQTEAIRSALRNFVVWMGSPQSTGKLNISSTGLAPLPSDFVYYLEVYHETGGKYTQIEVIDDQFLASRLSDALKKPTFKNPICSMYGQWIMFYPATLGAVHFKYFRLPRTPVWGYTIVNDVPVYNAATSVQLEWPEEVGGQLIPFILQYVAENLRENFMYQVAERQKETGT